MSHLKPGDPCPAFSGKDQNGNEIKLSQFSGKKLVLYFYPKDNTPGCTAEACNLRDHHGDLIREGYAVVGVSPDSEKSHQRFIEKFSLPFPLIADTDHAIATAFGVWAEKSMYGKTYMGILRKSFIIENGLITKVIDKVDTKDHYSQIK